MKTIINILGTMYNLWIYGQADKSGNYQDWKKTWEAGDVLNLQFHITEEDDMDAPRLAYQDDQLVLLPREERGSVFGYIWCSKEYMKGKNGYAHGLVGMRYGWEKARESSFSDPQTPEFNWRLRVSATVHKEMTKVHVSQKLPAGMSQTKGQAVLEEMPELFKKKISTLTFREKLMRFRRKPTTAVYAAIVDEFTSFSGERKLEVITALQQANFGKAFMVELIDELYDIGRKEDVIRQTIGEEKELPAGL